MLDKICPGRRYPGTISAMRFIVICTESELRSLTRFSTHSLTSQCIHKSPRQEVNGRYRDRNEQSIHRNARMIDLKVVRVKSSNSSYIRLSFLTSIAMMLNIVIRTSKVKYHLSVDQVSKLLGMACMRILTRKAPPDTASSISCECRPAPCTYGAWRVLSSARGEAPCEPEGRSTRREQGSTSWRK